MLATSNVIIKGRTLANEATLSHQTLTYSSSRGRIDHSITFNVDLTMTTINLARTLTAQLWQFSWEDAQFDCRATSSTNFQSTSPYI